MFVAKNVSFQDSYGEGYNFKVLENGTWYGAADGVNSVGEVIAISTGGGNIRMDVDPNSSYDIYIDGTNLKVCVVEAGETPAF